MSTEHRIQNRAELAFSSWARFIIKHRWLAILIPVLLTAHLVSYLPSLVIDNSTEGFLHPDDPISIRYRAFRDQFDRDDRIIVAIDPENVFAPEFVERLRLFHITLENELPYVEEITSLFNSRSTRGEGDELIVEDLLEGWLDRWPDDAANQLIDLRARVLDNPLYLNSLVSEDAGITTISIKPFTYSAIQSNNADEEALAGFSEDDSDQETASPDLLTARENDELMAALNAVVARFEGPGFPIYLGGGLPMTDHINRTMEKDMGATMGLSFSLILGLLFLLFRRISGAILPLVIVVLSLMSAIGVMILIDIPGSTAVQILPIFLLSVGICDAVHILTIFYQRLGVGETKHDAIAYALGHSGLAVVMTSVTTAAGMVSFVTGEMAPIAQLGIIAPIGVMLALAYTLVLLPAILSVIPIAPGGKKSRGGGTGALTRWLVRVGEFSVDHAGIVLALTAAATVFFAVGASQARFSHLATNWFEEGVPIREAAILLDRELRGTMSLEVILDTGRENGLHDPEVLERIEAAMRHAETIDTGEVFIGKAVSIVDVVKETHRALNENRPEFYRIPDDRQTIAQELLLFENGGAEDLEEIVDSSFRTARLSLRAPFVDAMLYGPFIELVKTDIEEIVGPDIQVEMTGFMPVLAGVVSAMITSMARSYAFALIVITPLMIVLLRDLRLGLMSMVPNLIPVIFCLGLMGWLDIPIDGSTMMIGAMVIGLAVDDTIHFMHKFRIYLAELGDTRMAIRATLESTGTALLFTTLVLTAGFAAFATSSMINTQHFGSLAASAIVVAFLADIIVAPAMLTMFLRTSNVADSLESDRRGVTVAAS